MNFSSTFTYYSVEYGVENAAAAVQLLLAGGRYNIPALENTMMLNLAKKADSVVKIYEQNKTRQRASCCS